MEEEKAPEQQTKFKGEGIVNATQFGKMVGCSLQAVKRMFGTKLTEGLSWVKDGHTTLIDIESAKKELMLSVKPSNCKNKELLTFLGYGYFDESASLAPGAKDSVSQMSMQKVREELQRSELRTNLINERILDGKYIERKVVEKNLEAMGIEVRNAFMGISSRVTPSMRAAANERDAENIIHRAFEDTLNTLSEILKKDIGAN